MEVGFRPDISLSAKNVEKPEQQSAAVSLVKDIPEDSVQLSTKTEKTQKKHTFKNFIADIAKFFVTTSEMVKGTVKAGAYGLATGAALLGGGWMFGALPNGFRKGGSLKEVCKSPFKSIPTKAKVVAGLGTAGVAAYHLIAAKLKANQRTADVDHQLKTGHRSV